MTASKDTESMGNEFMFARDPLAFTVNNSRATLSLKKLAMEMERRFGTKRRMDAWTRMDLHRKTFKTTERRHHQHRRRDKHQT